MSSSVSNIEKLIPEYSRLMSNQMLEIAKWANTEEDIRHECNKLIDGFIERAGLKLKGRHEYYLAGGRIDSKYARVLLEYKYPKGPKRITEDINSPGAKEVIGQLKKRFQDFQAKEHVEPEKLFGVGCDGDTLLFVYKRGGKLEVDDPRPTTPYNVERILRALVSLGAQGKSYKPSALADDFGAEAESPIAQKGIHELYEAITTTKNPKALTFFNQWKILFGEVCGYSVDKPTDKIAKLAEHYDIPKATKPAELLFAVHSYYAIFIKFLATEIVAPFSPMRTSKIKKCVAAPTSEALKREMEELEKGGIWGQLGITNFLEGDLFSWYIAAWDDHVAEAVRRLAAALDEYDPTTLSVDQNESRDLLKKLYQHLFPKSVRHDLGEYYTPDWLAEHVLNEIGYNGNPDKRLLDPACGSGTFLVMAINRVQAWFNEHRHECGFGEAELVQKILKNVIGFDLNPLAVMTARTNYLFAIRSLLAYASNVELPIYLCDSIMTPAEYGDFFSRGRKLKTSVAEFRVPSEIAESRELIGKYSGVVEFCVRNGYSAGEYLARCNEEGLPISEVDMHIQLYEELCRLERESKNGIWARIIKNAFAPLFVEKVDFVIGNPPWIRWSYLPPAYRTDTAYLWRAYGLFTKKGIESRMGTAEVDLSMLFTYICSDVYLKKKGSRLGFVINQEVFKSKGAGEGFRRFNVETKGLFLRPYRVDDLSSLRPFYAENKTCCIFLKKGLQSRYPVPYFLWNKKKEAPIHEREMNTVEAQQYLEQVEYVARPVAGSGSPWQTMPASSAKILDKIAGRQTYKARIGARVEPYGVYFIEVVNASKPNLPLIVNLPELGTTPIVKIAPMAMEADFIYPALRGKDIQQWRFDQRVWVLLTNKSTRKVDWVEERYLKRKYPLTFEYFFKFKDILLRRENYWKFFARTQQSRILPKSKKVTQHIRVKSKEGGVYTYDVSETPFFSTFNIGTYTFAPYKVCWSRMHNKIRACVISESITELGRKPLIPTDTVTLIPLYDPTEAHFLCALVNSSPFKWYVHSFSAAGRGFGSASIIKHVNLFRFVRGDKHHLKLAELSEQAHQAAAEGDTDKVKELEGEIDREAAKLWGITRPELKTIQDALKAMEPKTKRRNK